MICMTESQLKPTILLAPRARPEMALTPMLGNGGCNMCECPALTGTSTPSFARVPAAGMSGQCIDFRDTTGEDVCATTALI